VLGGALVLVLSGCGGGDKPDEAAPRVEESIELTSAAFEDGGTIPTRFTCSGEELSPPLKWSGVPKRAAELTVLAEDPDAGNFVHWKLLGLPPGATGVIEGSDKSGWRGPCPPEGDDPHRYVFTVYATDEQLDVDDETSIDEVHAALEDHAIARGTLTGRFSR